MFDVKDCSDAWRCLAMALCYVAVMRLTDWPKVTHEECLLPVLDAARHKLVCHEYGWDTAEDHDQEAEHEKPADADAGDVRHVEVSPGKDSPDIHEAAKVEKYVYAAVHLIVPLLRLLEVESVPVQNVSGDEASKEIVGSENTADSDGEELHPVNSWPPQQCPSS